MTISGSDAVPDMYIGRLPAQTISDAEAMVAKIRAHEQALSEKKEWWKNVVLVGDNWTEPWESVFETMNQDAAGLLPNGMHDPQEFYLKEYEDELLDVTDLTADLMTAINDGALIVNYSGHGSTTGWATELIIDNRGGSYREDTEDQFANIGKYPFVVSMTCLNGYFAYPEAWTVNYSMNFHSLGEGLMRAVGKGAAAALVPTSMTTTDGQHILNTALFDQIFTEDSRNIGPAIAAAKQELLANSGSDYAEISKTFILFGDPAMRLKVPLPRRPLSVQISRQSDNSVLLRWNEALDCNDDPVDGYNVYRRAGTTGDWVKLNTARVQVLEYVDSPLSARFAAMGGDSPTYYYAVTSVDEYGDESVKSAALSPPAAALALNESNAGGGSGGAACFVSAAQVDLSPTTAKIGLIFGGLILFFILIVRRERSWQMPSDKILDSRHICNYNVITFRSEGNTP